MPHPVEGKIAKVLIAGAGVCLVGLVLAGVYLGSTGAKDAMSQEKIDRGGMIGIPPIDVAVPTETETATFGLG